MINWTVDYLKFVVFKYGVFSTRSNSVFASGHVLFLSDYES